MNVHQNLTMLRPLLSLLLLSCSLFCQAVSFYAKYQGHKLDPSITSSWYISLYKDGERVKHESFYDKESVWFGTDDGSYTYLTDLNHRGTVNDGDIIDLKIGLFKYLLHDSDGNPLKGISVKIYEDGDEVKSITSNSEGIAQCYLAVGNKYAYKAESSSGSFAIVADKETLVDDNCISVMLKYQDLPVPGNYNLVADDGTESPSAYIYSYALSGRLTFACRYGRSYRIKNAYDVYSEPFTPTVSNNSFVVEHRKVTFVSGSDDPNILYDFKILGQSQFTNYESGKISDGKGYVVYYLMPGKYKYSHLGSIVPFEVDDTDLTLTLTTNPKTLRVTDVLGQGIPGQKIKILDSNGGMSQEYVSDNSGAVSFKAINDGCYAQVNGFGQFPVDTSASPEIRLTELIFDNKIFGQATSIILSDGKNTLSVNPGKHLWVPLNSRYTYSVFNGSQVLINNAEIDSSEGTVTVGENLNKVTFVASEENDTPLSGFRFYVYTGNLVAFNGSTDFKGECTVYLKDGFYEFKDQSMQVISAVAIDGDQMIKYVTPSEKVLTVNVDGRPWDGYVTFVRENGETVSMTCRQGIGRVRLPDNDRCAVAVGSMIHTCKVNVTDGMSLDFYETHVTSHGDGLAFPIVSYYYENTQTKMLGGENLHLVAVPAANSSFRHWLVNGERYESAVVDYKVSSAIDAVAVFETQGSSKIESIGSLQNGLGITEENGFLLFDRKICGNVDLYNASGVKVYSSYVVSDKMDISALTTGVYITVVIEGASQYSYKFIKK